MINIQLSKKTIPNISVIVDNFIRTFCSILTIKCEKRLKENIHNRKGNIIYMKMAKIMIQRFSRMKFQN